MGWVLFIVLIVTVAVFGIMISSSSESEHKESVEANTNEIAIVLSSLKKSGFKVSKKFYGDDREYVFAVDDENKKWVLNFSNERTQRIYEFSDLLSFDLIQNGNQIISGNAGNAAFGAVLFGAAGAVVGASAKKTVSDMCSDLHIEISVNDLNRPYLKIPFISESMAVGSPIYEARSENARKLMSVLSYIKANAEQTKTETPEQPEQKVLEQPKTDIYEEIEKLHALKENGILTEEEFTQKKKSLLGI